MGWLGGDEPPDDPKAVLEAENGRRQWHRLCELVDQALADDAFELTVEVVCELNRLAVDGLVDSAGVYRLGPCKIINSKHVPPPFEEVPGHVDDMLRQLGPVPFASAPATRGMQRAAFALWRLNWIHPFEDGNGRTARAVAYLVHCRDINAHLVGIPPWPARILARKPAYYHCLEEADDAWRRSRQTRVNVNNLAGYLTALLQAQLRDAGFDDDPTSGRPPPDDS